MTLLPATGVRGSPGKSYEVNEICAEPSCALKSVHGHHLWARSYLRGQPYEWVELSDGTIVGNKVGLCLVHHNQVTGEIGGYRARIVLSSGLFWWEKRVDEETWVRVGLLSSQPPGARQVPKSAVKSETCPTCGKPKRKREPLPRRRSKTWTVIVPDDAEVGAEILDEWVEEIATILGFGDESSRLKRYHVLSITLAWLAQGWEAFMRDVAEAAERLS